MIKICGIGTAATLDAAIAARVEFVGFNFYPPSPRFLKPDQAAALGARAAGRIGKVGVFVDADDRAIYEAVEAGALDGQTPYERLLAKKTSASVSPKS